MQVQLQMLYCVPVADAEVPPVCPHCTPCLQEHVQVTVQVQVQVQMQA